MKYIEWILIALFIVALALHYLDLPGYAFFSGVSLTCLSIMYFNLGFALFNKIGFRKIFKKTSYQTITVKDIVLAIFTGTFLSVFLVGTMFSILNMEGAKLQTVVGLIGSIVALLFTFIYRNQELKLRLIFWLFLGGIIQFV